MTTLFMEGFNVYGPSANDENTAMTETRWATVSGSLSVPAWGARTGSFSFAAAESDIGARTTYAVLPAAPNNVWLSFGLAISQLVDSDNGILSMYDSTGEWLRLRCNNDGSVTLCTNSSGGITNLVSSDGPVFDTAQWYALEYNVNLTGGAGSQTFELKVNGNVVINYTGGTFNNGSATPTAATGFMLASERIYPEQSHGFWFADIIVHDGSGSYMNGWMGDLRCVTIWPNGNGSNQGWTGYPRANPSVTSSVGIFDNTPTGADGVYIAGDTTTDLGSGDFTLEGFWRFSAFPTGGNIAILAQKWNDSSSKQSYRLWLDSSNNINFAYTTDGTNSTLHTPISYPTNIILDHWYHIAIVRTSGEDLFFLNGVQQGVPVADTATYYAATTNAHVSVCADVDNVATGTTMSGFVNQVRLTVGAARYTSNFSMPTAPFPTGVSDPDYADVGVLFTFNGTAADAGPNTHAVTVLGNGVCFTVDDSGGDWATINYKLNTEGVLRDDTFIEADLVPAAGILTFTSQPANASTVTVGTYGAGPTTATYTFKNTIASAFDVLIDSSLAQTISNLAAAINAGSGSGTKYGAGTVVNNNVTAVTAQGLQLLVTATIAGTGGNSIASTVSGTVNASWGGSTLAGGANIPGVSDFSYQRPPPDTTAVYAAEFQTRMSKIDGGTASVQVTMVGAEGGTESGTAHSLSGSANTENFYYDVFETDPDTGVGLTVSTIVGMKGRFNRTA